MEAVQHYAQMIDLDLSHILITIVVAVIGYFLKGIHDDIKDIKKTQQKQAIAIAKINTHLKIQEDEDEKE